MPQLLRRLMTGLTLIVLAGWFIPASANDSASLVSERAAIEAVKRMEGNDFRGALASLWLR